MDPRHPVAQIGSLDLMLKQSVVLLTWVWGREYFEFDSGCDVDGSWDSHPVGCEWDLDPLLGICF